MPRLPEHHWVRLYSTQLWPSQAADARAGPSLSDWSEVIRYHWSRERENDSWLLLISDSKNTLLLLQIISVSTWPGNVLNRYKTYTIILFINSVDKLRNEFQDWVWWMKLTKKVCCLWTVENQLWNCGSSCLLQCAGPSGSERRVHESCNNFRANSLPLPQTNNQNLSICATMEADKSVGEEVNHIVLFSKWEVNLFAGCVDWHIKEDLSLDLCDLADSNSPLTNDKSERPVSKPGADGDREAAGCEPR